MTKDQALVALKEGKAITHIHFTEEEYIEQSSDTLNSYIDENGYIIHASDFWLYRQDKAFDTDWSIYTP